ncbi:MAG TPA: hypothetical protein VLK84_21055, partial [Longimicrobium sp.]|nr:hypothetical protein [Longimicrobium sp.]
MRLLFAFLLVLAASVSVPAAAQVEGSFRLTQINGQPLPSASPAETNIIIHGMNLRLGADARYTMGFRVRRDGTDERFQVEASGTYRTEGDQLLLLPDPESVGEPVTYRWTLSDGVLRLYDEQENEYRLARQAAAAAGEPWTPGTWNAVQMNGQPLPEPWPTEPRLIITQLSFEFTEDGQATARLTGTMAGEPAEEVNRGRYRIDGDRLIILDDDGEVDEEFGWTRGDGMM